MELKQLHMNKIVPNPFQPRMKFDKGKLQELGNNIKKYGLIEPIVVKKKGKQYMIVAGERRWRASKIAGKNKIYAIVKKYNSDIDIKRDSLVENELRENLNYEEFKTFTFSLAKALGKPYWNKGYVNGRALAKYIVGTNNSGAPELSSLSNKIAEIYSIEKNATRKVKNLIKNEKLGRVTAYRISKIKDKSVQNELADLAKHKTSKEIREEVSRHNLKQEIDAINEKKRKENSLRPKFTSKGKVFYQILGAIDTLDQDINYAISKIKEARTKKFWQNFDHEARMKALDTLKPLRRDLERSLQITTKLMETIGGIQ